MKLSWKLALSVLFVLFLASTCNSNMSESSSHSDWHPDDDVGNVVNYGN